MRAMLLDHYAPVESQPLRLKDVAQPQPGQGEARVKVACCAVCRTDLHVIEGELPHQKLPVIPGHMIVGRVDALGPACEKLKVGDRVGIAWLRHACGVCEPCWRGRENLCVNSLYTASHAAGGDAAYAGTLRRFSAPASSATAPSSERLSPTPAASCSWALAPRRT